MQRYMRDIFVAIDLVRDFFTKSIPVYEIDQESGHTREPYYVDGALAVEGGWDVLGPIVDYITDNRLFAVASREMHPGNHCSFVENGGDFKRHCLVGSPGAQLVPEIDSVADAIVSKGTDRDVEEFSAFEAVLPFIVAHRPRRVFFGGLTTEYCVDATVMRALQFRAASQRGLGHATDIYDYEVVINEEWMRAINPEEGEKAISRMVKAGATLF